MKYRAFAVQFEGGCAKKYYSTFETNAPVDSILFNALLEGVIEREVGVTTCLIHYCGLNDDGSSQLNDYRFVWTGTELHKY
jgi:hypothetical protein